MKKTENKGISGGGAAAFVVSAAALAGAAYYLLGPKAKEHQKSAKKWSHEAKQEIAKRLIKAKNLSKSIYEKIVDDVVEPYIAKGATAKEVSALARALKKDWTGIVKAVKEDIEKK